MLLLAFLLLSGFDLKATRLPPDFDGDDASLLASGADPGRLYAFVAFDCGPVLDGDEWQIPCTLERVTVRGEQIRGGFGFDPARLWFASPWRDFRVLCIGYIRTGDDVNFTFVQAWVFDRASGDVIARFYP